MRKALTRPIIYLITAGDLTESNFERRQPEIESLLEHAIACGVSVIQIREKNLAGRTLFHLTSSIVNMLRETNIPLLVNDRADIAIAAGADGVHLPANGVRASDVRLFAPKNFLVGVSTHSIDEASAAKNEGADFAVFGPIFESPGKGDAVGLEKLSEATATLDPFPLVGLGGIDETNAQQVLVTHSAGIAAIRFLNDFNKLEKLKELL